METTYYSLEEFNNSKCSKCLLFSAIALLISFGFLMGNSISVQNCNCSKAIF